LIYRWVWVNRQE